MRTVAHELRRTLRFEADTRERAAPLVIVLDTLVPTFFICDRRRGSLCSRFALLIDGACGRAHILLHVAAWSTPCLLLFLTPTPLAYSLHSLGQHSPLFFCSLCGSSPLCSLRCDGICRAGCAIVCHWTCARYCQAASKRNAAWNGCSSEPARATCLN